jgi:hypothetical protein
MNSTPSKTHLWMFILLIGLSVSIGWGIRGQFGHEYGAALAGAIGGIAIALASGRQDWLRRVPFFAVFGAIGFGFGGSMSYMKDIAFTHSSDPATVLYGFACVFIDGALWAAPAGAGLALVAYLDREQLTRLYVLACSVLGLWYVRDCVVGLLPDSPTSEFLGGYTANAILAALVVLAVRLFRRQYCGFGSLLILYMSAGWLAGQFVLIDLVNVRLNPPKPEFWACCLGMTLGILACCWHKRQSGIAFGTLGALFLGGIGFALGTAIKITVMASGFTTNWHSVMEQTQGLMLGIALAIVFALLIPRSPVVSDEPPVRRWSESFSVVFVLWLLPYLNFRYGPGEWVGEVKNLTASLYGIPITANFQPSDGFIGWLDFVALALLVAIVLLLVLHRRKPLACVPASWLGRAQLFYLVFIWSITAMNFTFVLPRFTPIRLVTEWFICLNATFCSVFVFYTSAARPPLAVEIPADRPRTPWIRRTVLFGTLGAILVCFLGFGVKLAFWGNQSPIKMGVVPIRFGPHNTNDIP